MGIVKARLIFPLMIFACACVGVWGLAASARAEEGTTTPKEELPPVGEAIAEPIQPVKEAVEAAVPPKAEVPATAAPTTAPPTTTTSETSSGSPGAASPTPVTKPKPSTGPSATSTSTSHGGGGGNAGGGVHHAAQPTGSTGSQGSTETSTAGGESQGESEVLGTSATSETEGLAVTAPEAGQPAGHAASPTVNATEAHGGADPRSTVNLDDARPVEAAPKPKASPSPLTTVGRVLSRPFKEGASLPAVPLVLIVLFAAAAIGWFFWFDWESPSRGAAGVEGGRKELPEEGPEPRT